MIKTLIGLLIFLSIFLAYFGFYFPIVNNVEELPLIYKMLGIASYPNDDFVTYHTENFTQIYPFLFLLTSLIKIFSIQNISYFYFICFLSTISFYYLFLYKIQNSIAKINPIVFSFLLNVVFVIFDQLPFVPADRWAINNFFDPELLVFVLIFGFISQHFAAHFKSAAVFLFLASLHYPVYVIPLMPAILVTIYPIFRTNRLQFYKISFSYFIPSLTYILFLWTVSRQTEGLEIDVSLIMEFVRAPWHYQIPTPFEMFFTHSIFFSLILLSNISILIAIYIFKNKFLTSSFQKYNYLKAIFCFNILLILTLFLTSLVNFFIRIPLLIQISPYRIGVFVALLTALILIGISTIFFRDRFKTYYQIAISRNFQLIACIL